MSGFCRTGSDKGCPCFPGSYSQLSVNNVHSWIIGIANCVGAKVELIPVTCRVFLSISGTGTIMNNVSGLRVVAVTEESLYRIA